jgi:serine/threonine protein kinase
MICAACGCEWHTSRNSCPRCGFHMPVTAQAHQSGHISFDEHVAPYPSRNQSGGLASSSGPSRPLFPQAGHRPAQPLAAPPGGAFSRPNLAESGVGTSQAGGPPRPQFFQTGRPPGQPLAPPPGEAFSRPDLAEGKAGQRPFSDPLPSHPGGAPLRPIPPGTLLRAGRYRVQELQSRQDWHAGAFEAIWIGRDFRREVQVIIHEVGIPGATAERILPIMHTATIALLALQHYPQVAAIVDAFNDQGRSFFVFELIQGETLMGRMRHLQRPLPEQEVVEFCLQMADILETLDQKAPSLVHGAIRPEHIYRAYNGSRYILCNFSILVAGRATQLMANGEGVAPSPYTAPEFVHGFIDIRSDIYAVLATAYHLITGRAPAANATPPALSVNPAVSQAFSAILTRGLHFSPQQRYQDPSQLRQELVSLRLSASTASASPLLPAQGNIADSFPSLQNAPAFPARPNELPPSMSYLFPIVPPSALDEEQTLVPAPETLPPLRMGHERLEAVLMLLAALLALGLMTALSNFHV